MTSSTSYLNRLALLLLICSLCGCQVKNAPVWLDAVPPVMELRIAIYPIENLSSVPAPLKELRADLLLALQRAGLQVIGNDETDRFLARNWIRYTGGIDPKTAQLLRNDTGADAVLITSLDLYDDAYPPRIGMITRLVFTGETPEIFWMDSVGLTGDDAPGLLGLGLVEEPKRLGDMAIERLRVNLERHLQDPDAKKRLNGLFLSRYASRFGYRGTPVTPGEKQSVAVVPFYDRSTRKHAGEIELLHLVRQLATTRQFRVLEPGVIRDRMLTARIIMNDGISTPYSDLIANSLGADLLMTGKIYDYQDPIGGSGTPRVDFSVQVYERQTKRVDWYSRSYNNGDDGVFFYDWGRVNTANALAEKMNRALLREMTGNGRRNDEKEKGPAFWAHTATPGLREMQ